MPRRHGLSPTWRTELLPVLRCRGVRTIVLAGVSVNVALLLAAGETVQEGFGVVVPRDAVAGTPAAALDGTEARSEMSVWSMLASPLLAGNDLTRMTATRAAILTNAAVLAVDQDPLGAAPVPVPRRDGLLLWTRPLADGHTGVLAVNRSDSPRAATLTAAELALPATAAGYRATDLWTGTITTTADGSLPLTLAPHAATLLRLAPATTAPARP
nr:isochorismatase family protein [Frankia sp. QA3]